MNPPDLIQRIAAIVGARGAITDPAEIKAYAVDWRGQYAGSAALVVKPASGDGNIHFNASRALVGESDADFMAKAAEVNRIVHDITHRLDGSISAEHGLGQLKRDEIKRYKSWNSISCAV